MKGSKKVALITGITGQDGSYLSELLLEKGYIVHGIVRRTSNLLRSRIEHLRRDEKIYGRRLFLHYGDLADSTTLRRILDHVRPTELYHLAAKTLSHARSRARLRESHGIWIASWCSAIWRARGTGGVPRITCRRCG